MSSSGVVWGCLTRGMGEPHPHPADPDDPACTPQADPSLSLGRSYTLAFPQLPEAQRGNSLPPRPRPSHGWGPMPSGSSKCHTAALSLSQMAHFLSGKLDCAKTGEQSPSGRSRRPAGVQGAPTLELKRGVGGLGTREAPCPHLPQPLRCPGEWRVCND